MPRPLALIVALGLLARLIAIGELAAAPCARLYMQALLSVATAYGLYLLGRRRFSPRIAIGMAAAWSFYPAAVLLTAMPRVDTLLLFLWVAALVIYDAIEERAFPLPGALVLGVVLGLALLLAPVALVLAASILTYIGLIRYETPAFRRWRAVAAAFSVCVLLVLTARFAGGFPPATARGMHAISSEKMAFATAAFVCFCETDAGLWIETQSRPSVPGVIQPAPSASPWTLAIMAFPYMGLVCLGVAGFYLVRHFPARGLFLLQLFYGILWLRAPVAGSDCGHHPEMPALVAGAAALLRPRVWQSAPLWRRLFLLWTLGMLMGIWLNEALVRSGR